MSDVICDHCGSAVPVPTGFQLVPVARNAPETGQPADSADLSFEQQQEALFKILKSYQDAD